MCVSIAQPEIDLFAGFFIHNRGYASDRRADFCYICVLYKRILLFIYIIYIMFDVNMYIYNIMNYLNTFEM